MKYADCYWCRAHERSLIPYGCPTCLLGEKQSYTKSKYGFISARATRHNCKPKSIKEYCQRGEQWIKDSVEDYKRRNHGK